MRYGQLELLFPTGKLTTRGSRILELKCSCGKIVRISEARLNGTPVTSCGCRNKTPTYASWVAMKDRCYRKNHVAYEDYGGRGISVCERWRNSFDAFLADMGERPAKTTLDRKEVNLGYSPDNCKWATDAEQCRNRRSTKLNKYVVLGILHSEQSSVALAEELGVHPSTVSRVRAGKRWIEEAA